MPFASFAYAHSVRIGVAIYAPPELNIAACGNALKKHISYRANEIITASVQIKKHTYLRYYSNRPVYLFYQFQYYDFLFIVFLK
jgi:uncharacterized protein YcfL